MIVWIRNANAFHRSNDEENNSFDRIENAPNVYINKI